MKVAFEKYKSRVTINTWFKCVIAAFGLIIVAWFIELSNSLLFSTSVSAWVKGVYYVGLSFIIGSIVWLILYISPRLFQLLFGDNNAETKPIAQQPQQTPPTITPPIQPAAPKTEAAPESQIRWIPVYPEAPAAHEESESEKLRREFRNRTL
jgi:hypothetical protein